MTHRINDGKTTNGAGNIAACLALVAALTISGRAGAEAASHDWQARADIHLTGIANYYRRDDDSTNFHAVAATAELRIFSTMRPFSGGAFADYRVSSRSRFDRSLNLGAYARYNLANWDVTGWLFMNRAPGGADTWLHAVRLRYRVMEGAKLGIEATAPLEDARAANVMLGYYLSPAGPLSVKVLAGTKLNGDVDAVARIELGWQIR